MLIGLLFALLAVAGGIAVQRGLRLSSSVAPVSGLAVIAVLTSWATALHLPPLVSSVAVTGLAVAGLVVLFREAPSQWAYARRCRAPALLLVTATLLPVLLLGSVFANVEAPVSTHDGAFHVETIDNLRRGVLIQSWYPMGFHASVAAVLGLAPWLDSARGTIEAGQGLAVLAPLAVFALALAFGTDALVASLAAVIVALTWTYPYDYHLWGGWPQGMGVVLVIGVWVAMLRWLERPSVGWAALGSVFAGAIVVTHGTDLYSAVCGVLVILIARFRQIDLHRLVQQLPLALAVTVVAVGPYLLTVLHWAGMGAAVSAGQALADSYAASADDAGTNWMEFAVNVTGTASFVDLPLRLALIGLGLTLRPMRLAAGLWLAFVALLLMVEFIALPFVSTLFALTYPWLDGRPREIVVLFAAILLASGLSVCVAFLGKWRSRLPHRANLTRRVAVVCVVLLAFFGEGSAVSIYKRLAQSAADQNVIGTDDAAAMTWLRAHAQPGEVLANNGSHDAGIWAPYKASMPILVPRSGAPDMADRAPILEHVLDLNAAPAARAKACDLHVDYFYMGARTMPYDETPVPDRAALAVSPDLQEVFSSGEAAIFRINVPCP